MPKIVRAVVMIVTLIVAGIKVLTSYESVTADNQVLATNGLVYASSGPTVTVDLFLPAPSASRFFYKVFALEELPAKEEN